MVSLSQGQKVNLSKEAPNLKQALIGLGWSVNAFDGDDYDLDASVFLTDANGKCPSENDFIFYSNLQHPSGSVIHTGDNRTGEGEGDDEQIKIYLDRVPSNIQKISFVVTIYEADKRNQNFGDVSDAYIVLRNMENNQEILRYDLSEDYSTETALIVAELYRSGNEWKFSAVGKGWQGGLAAVCRHFGINA